MNEELIKLIPELKEALAQGLEYGGELFTRAVQYYIQMNILWSIIFFINLIIVSILVYKATKEVKKELIKDNYTEVIPVVILTGIVALIIPFCLFINRLTVFIKLSTIPEIYILEQITKLL